MKQITEEQYKKLKQDVERAKTESDQARGALNQLMSRLQEEFECEDVEEAKQLLARLEKESEKAYKDFADAMDAYKEKWGDD